MDLSIFFKNIIYKKNLELEFLTIACLDAILNSDGASKCKHQEIIHFGFMMKILFHLSTFILECLPESLWPSIGIQLF